MRLLLLSLIPAVLLAACGTPYDRCVSQNTRERSQLLRQIGTHEDNIERGYALHSQRVPITTRTLCERTVGGKPVHYPCSRTDWEWIETPVAIDYDEERAKIAKLKARLPALERQYAEVTQQCRIAHPEE